MGRACVYLRYDSMSWAAISLIATLKAPMP